jgi:hypothetical protein
MRTITISAKVTVDGAHRLLVWHGTSLAQQHHLLAKQIDRYASQSASTQATKLALTNALGGS